MPGIYRAPEVILYMDWDCKIDIWSIGTMVSSTSLLNGFRSTVCDDSTTNMEG